MSNLANFSPFKRTYQFMHIQNSAYHLKNKRQVKPMVKTNIKPNKLSQSLKFDRSTRSRSQIKKSDRYSQTQSQLIPEQSNQQSYAFREPSRVIHKNAIFERAKSARIDNQNRKMVEKLIDADCMIVSRTNAAQSYKKHRKYSSLIRRYQQNGERIVTPVVNLNKISPTIADYQNSRVQSIKKAAVLDHNPEYIANNWLE